MLEIPYDYIFLNLLNSINKFELKTSVSRDKAISYFDKFVEESKKNAEELGYKDVAFDEDDFDSRLEEFLDEYSDYFYMEGDTIYIHEDIDMGEIDDTIAEMCIEDEVSEIFQIPCESIDFLRIIDCLEMYKEVKSLLRLEFELEKSYQRYVNNPSQDNINKLNAQKIIKSINMNNIRSMTSYHLSGVETTLFNFIGENTHEYEKYPIDTELWDNVPHKFNNISHTSVFCNDYQFAIFGDRPLGYFKLEKEVDLAFEESNTLDDSVASNLLAITKNEDRVNRLFYKKYIKNLDDYLMEYGPTPDILKTKARLLYFLDRDDSCLYTTYENDKEMQLCEKTKLLPSQIMKIADEAYFFILELFTVPNDEKRMQKLLLMKTYYNMTQDKEFMELFDMYVSEPHYEEYREFIFGRILNLNLNLSL